MAKYFKTVFTITYVTEDIPIDLLDNFHAKLEEDIISEARMVGHFAMLERVELSAPQVVKALKAMGFEDPELAEITFNLDPNGKPLPPDSD